MSLSDVKIRNLKTREKSFKQADEKGLYLEVFPNGSRLWRMKYRYGGKENRLSFGAYPDVTLKSARERRDSARTLLAEGIDPSRAKKQEKMENSIRANNTFISIAEELIEKNAREGQSPRTLEKQRWVLALLGPEIAKRPITEITSQELLIEMKKQEKRGKLESAKRMRAFASRVFRFAATTARAERDPAALLQGALISPKVKHFAAITDPLEFGALLRAIDDYQGDPAVMHALRLTPHVFQRPGEIRHMEWEEIDLEKALWKISIHKMKMREPHAVPLSQQALEILSSMKGLSGSGRFVFPSIRTRLRPISENTVNAALRRMGYTGKQMTAHGFRTTASSLLNESGKWNPDAIERALAHRVSGEIRKIYNRSAYWNERIEMAQWWSDYIDGLRTNTGNYKSNL